jgi:hypothetical protein
VQRVESRATTPDVSDHGHQVKDMAFQADTDRTVRHQDFAEEDTRIPRHAFRTIRRGTYLLALAAVAATLLAACDGGSSKRSTPPPRISPPMSLGAAARSATARVSAGILFVSRGIAVDGIAADPHHLVWETGPFEDESTPTVLHQRPLAGGPTRTLATAVVPSLGVASTTRWVVYAAARGTTSSLMAVHHDGSGAHRLAAGLVAPLAKRGSLVAWAEERAGTQRVVVSDLDENRTWVAAAMPRCVRGRCYRIDAVTLSDSGVVFDRGAIGPQPSLVVRRAFTAAQSDSVRLGGDPQPYLVGSSSGAAYRWAGHGWYLWDFGQTAPRPATDINATEAAVAYERGRWLLLAGDRCRPGLVAQGGGRPPRTVVPAATLDRLVDHESDVCFEQDGLALAGTHVLTTWALVPRHTAAEHSDEGLLGVAVAARAAR